MTAIIFVVAMDIPFSLVTIRLFGSINSFSLMAIPFFVLAGNIMGKAQITDKLVNFANAAVGQFKGGLGYVNILTLCSLAVFRAPVQQMLLPLAVC